METIGTIQHMEEAQPNNLIINDTLSVPMWEIRFTFARSGGPGGQHVNKTNSKAILHWFPEHNHSLPEPVKLRFMRKFAHRLTTDGELVMHCDTNREQHRNRDEALDRLRAMLLEVATAPRRRVMRKKISKSRKKKQRKSREELSEKKSRRRAPPGGWD